MPQQLGHKGSAAILGVRSSFSHLTTSSMDKVSFDRWLSTQNLHMSTHDIDTMCNYFDIDGHGHLNIEAFILGMRGDLNDRRMSIVLKAYAKTDSEDTGFCNTADLMENFNVSMMPEVRKGTLSEDSAKEVFLHRLEGTADVLESNISKEQFVDYYSWLACSIISDDTFVTLVETAWGVSEADVGENRFNMCVDVLMGWADEKVKGVTDKVKQKQLMMLTLRHFDLENKGSLFVPQFMQATHRMSCSMSEEIAQLFFDKFAVEGKLDYYVMTEALYEA
ncbi:hypothetical protein TL16_g03321 [Triparma laevis f. inornata]|uniref:Calmodulin n=1 Tax=Triparma laevis f. inornata TaxID=1714386 RepID=A0A9W7A0C8_9STRA|nr:hypothetical protein TL16_g03321 [Triparma laevis f. inornata]